MANLPKSRLLYNIRGHLVFNTAFAFLVSMVHFLTPQHIIDDLHVRMMHSAPDQSCCCTDCCNPLKFVCTNYFEAPMNLYSYGISM